MYGAVDGDAPVDEGAALRPLTPYAESKVRAEEALHELAGDGFSPVSMRNATAYGASPRLRLDIVLNNLVAWAHTTGAIKLLSDGSSWRPLVHIRDIARATLALLAPPAGGAREGGVQHRQRRAELPDPRPGGDGQAAAARLRDHVRRRRLTRPTQLPRRLHQVRVIVPRLPLRVDGGARRRRAR